MRVLSSSGAQEVQSRQLSSKEQGPTVEHGFKHIADLGPQLDRHAQIEPAGPRAVGILSGGFIWERCGGGDWFGPRILDVLGRVSPLGRGLPPARLDLTRRQPCQGLLVGVSGADDSGSAALGADGLGAVTDQSAAAALPALLPLGETCCWGGCRAGAVGA